MIWLSESTNWSVGRRAHSNWRTRLGGGGEEEKTQAGDGPDDATITLEWVHLGDWIARFSGRRRRPMKMSNRCNWAGRAIERTTRTSRRAGGRALERKSIGSQLGGRLDRLETLHSGPLEAGERASKQASKQQAGQLNCKRHSRFLPPPPSPLLVCFLVGALGRNTSQFVVAVALARRKFSSRWFLPMALPISERWTSE